MFQGVHRPPQEGLIPLAGPKITLRDAVACGYCGKGIREWAKRHDLNYRDVIRDGIDVEELAKMDDAAAQDVVRKYGR